MREMLKAIFFDLDNTLHDESAERFFAAVEATCEQVGDLGVSPATMKAAYLAGNLATEAQLAGPRDESPGTNLDIDIANWQRTLAACGVTGDAAAMAKTLRRQRLERLQLFGDTPSALKQLGDSFKLGLITNGQGDMQRAKLATLGLEPFFEWVLVSGELGVGKPAPGIFAEAAKRAGFALQECAHIGDSLATDVAGAKAAGVLAVWLNREGRLQQPPDPIPDVQVRTLTEAADYLLGLRSDR